MFDIKLKDSSNWDLPLISHNYKLILEDENPILYVGSNALSNRIIGVIIEEDDNGDLLYFHLLVSDMVFNNFVNKTITLRNAFSLASQIFVIKKTDDEFSEYGIISFDDIPTKYLPFDDSYCPTIKSNPSLNYSISLKGKLSDDHKIEANDGNEIQKSFFSVIDNSLKIKGVKLYSRTLYELAEAGSFKLNFRIELNPEAFLTVDESLITGYLNNVLDFVLNKLKKSDNSVKNQDIDTADFNEVYKSLQDIYESNYVTGISELEIKKSIVSKINSLASEFEDISEQIKHSNSFNRVEVINYTTENQPVTLGLVDDRFYGTIKSQIITKNKDDVTIDAAKSKYRIRVYHFNNETGNCWAHYYTDADINSERSYKIPIKIKRNNKSFKNCFATKSLDEDKVVEVKGKAERDNGRVISITVEL